MIKATKKANRKNKEFRNKVTFFPKNLISRGIVTKPTVVSVEMKTAICINPAPFFTNSEATGKATKTGIKAIAPNTEERIIPLKPDSTPIILCIVSESKTASKKLTRKRMERSCGRTDKKIFLALFKASLVFILSFLYDMINKIAVRIYRK